MSLSAMLSEEQVANLIEFFDWFNALNRNARVFESLVIPFSESNDQFFTVNIDDDFSVIARGVGEGIDILLKHDKLSLEEAMYARLRFG